MVLQPLEFSECLTDSPYFREKLLCHEKELEKTSKAIKGLVKECQDLMTAAIQLSKAQKNFSKLLMDFELECIGSEKTDDEVMIEGSLREFGRIISLIEESRSAMIERVQNAVLVPLDKFRKEKIGEAKKSRQVFEKQTNKFYQTQEKYLQLKPNKVTEQQLLDADATLELERHSFCQDSMTYVLRLQEVQEKKKFEFVELLLQFMYSWLTFYHEGYECYNDFQPSMKELSSNLQKCRANFDSTRSEAESLMKKMLDNKNEHIMNNRLLTKVGYLFMFEKKALTTSWTKYYCEYNKEQKMLSIIPYNQQTGNTKTARESYTLTSCTRRAGESIERRFCFDVTVHEKSQPLTFQANSEDDRRSWLEAMDGREPVCLLDDIGFSFIKKCIQAIEMKGLQDEGLYRVVGVNSKVLKLTAKLLDRKKADKIDLLNDPEGDWEMKTITSALKNYFRALPEPLLTFKLHHKFIKAAKQESKTLRVNDIHELVHQLPESNFEMLELLIAHLKKVSEYSSKNLMGVSNIGVCFGPTLMRPEEETMAAIMDIKFCNLVVEILIENYVKVYAFEANDAPSNAATPVTVLRQTNSRFTTVTTTTNTPVQPSPMSSKEALVAPYNQIMRNHNPANRNQSQQPQPSSGSQPRSISAFASPSLQQSSHSLTNYNLRSSDSPIESLNFRCSNTSVATNQSNFSTTPNWPIKSINNSKWANYNSGLGGSSADGMMTISSVSSTGSKDEGSSRRNARTLYSCTAENESELSFEPNEIIRNGWNFPKILFEPGWLEGTLNGRYGMVPANYVEFIN
ncbi:hypothetical protein HELRODRAFT_110355 [Helobdella robusta]|uniref:Rho GTPase-activating protein 26 n=1 Tax=Helobdella robusta TaxID=6412 RepID=T1EF17_HELRO|nr:hypothetical protein HELRODRAFT_110355 [Helobdella robusta]ESO08116.1 hypothetical protein HELRODRAFT_110355 [Helobdella robusta]